MLIVVGRQASLAASKSIGWASRLDVMLKPPEGLLAGVPGIDGTTLLGDGRVLIVLDLARNLRQRGRLTKVA